MIVRIKGRGIARGCGEGPLLSTTAPISFLSGVDPASGVIIERGHPLEGKKITGCVLAFPYGKGSTVGSYVLYALSRRGIAPAAILNTEAEPIIAVGAIIGGIPMADRPSIPLERLQDGTVMRVNGTTGEIEYEGELLPPGGPSPTGRQGEN